MLSNLNIENIAVIERASIDFDGGLNVLTGETGAGKSMIIDALNAVLGERTSKELIRTGTDRARVSALFEDLSVRAKATLAELGLQDDEGSLLMQRELTANGKSTFRINGCPVTASMVKEIGKSLINIHGQHENQQLLSPHAHIHYIDGLGDLQWQVEAYYKAYRRAVDLKHQIASLDMDEQEKERRIDLLAYQIDELEKAEISDGEREQLMERKTLIANAEKIAKSLQEAHLLLSGDSESSGIVEMLESVADQMAESGKYMPEMAAVAEKITGMTYELQDISAEVRDRCDNMDVDSGELEQIEERLDLLYRLSQKYGRTEAEMLAYLEKAQTELAQIQDCDTRRAALEEAYQEAGKAARKLALELSEARKMAAMRFSEAVQTELAFLDMPFVKLVVRQEPCALNATGCDEIEFLMSTNPGEPPKPIAKIASGGELSRMMLAIKNVLADKDDIDTLIFDEVDAGISGRAAQKVGIKLREVAANRQVLCVTHLAQIAAQAHNHLLIEKQVSNGRTFTEVRPLDRSGRKYELARIMSGAEPSEAQLQSAEEMLVAAERK